MRLWDVIDKKVVLAEDHHPAEHDPTTGSGYPPPDDPRLLHGEPGGQARFVQKHMPHSGKRITDVDPSTLDDNLFKAANIRRSVPEKDGDTHGHTPVGRDASVYESLMARIFKDEKLDESSVTGSDASILKTYGIANSTAMAHALRLLRTGKSHAAAAAETIRKFNLGA